MNYVSVTGEHPCYMLVLPSEDTPELKSLAVLKEQSVWTQEGVCVYEPQRGKESFEVFGLRSQWETLADKMKWWEMMRRLKCSDATERKWNLRNMLENEKEPRDGGTGRGWRSMEAVSRRAIKGLSDSQKWVEWRTDVSAESETRSDSGRGRDRERRR